MPPARHRFVHLTNLASPVDAARMRFSRSSIVVVAIAFSALLSAAPVGATTSPSSWSGRYDLYRSGVFSSQQTMTWCVAASVQMMLNIVRGQSDRCGDVRQPGARLHDASGFVLTPALRSGTFVSHTVVQSAQAVAIDAAVPAEVAALIGCCVATGVGAALPSVALAGNSHPAGPSPPCAGLSSHPSHWRQGRGRR